MLNDEIGGGINYRTKITIKKIKIKLQQKLEGKKKNWLEGKKKSFNKNIKKIKNKLKKNYTTLASSI